MPSKFSIPHLVEAVFSRGVASTGGRVLQKIGKKVPWFKAGILVSGLGLGWVILLVLSPRPLPQHLNPGVMNGGSHTWVAKITPQVLDSKLSPINPRGLDSTTPHVSPQEDLDLLEPPLEAGGVLTIQTDSGAVFNGVPKESAKKIIPSSALSARELQRRKILALESQRRIQRRKNEPLPVQPQQHWEKISEGVQPMHVEVSPLAPPQSILKSGEGAPKSVLKPELADSLLVKPALRCPFEVGGRSISMVENQMFVRSDGVWKCVRQGDQYEVQKQPSAAVMSGN